VLGTIESMAAEYYDPTSDAPAERWEKRPSGDVDLGSGRLTGEDFPDNGHWKQV
jgi:hypothetical protein